MSKKKRRFADDGWALWIDGDSKSTIYLNEWMNPKGKSYVDVSVRIYGAKEAKNVNIYVPFKISDGEFKDLSEMLSDNQVLRALFNTNGVLDTEKNKYTSELRYDKRVVSLINIDKDFTAFKSVAAGTIITFDFDFIKESITSDEAYLIFRIPHKTIDRIFEAQIDVQGSFDKLLSLIQSPVISEKYGYSVRINEARLLPTEINAIETLQEQKIKKALVTITVEDDYELNDSTCYRIRRLEEDLLKDYTPEGYPTDNSITYQWVEERNMNMKAHYNFYFTITREAVNNMSMIVYIFILLFFGAMGGIVESIIRAIFKF